MRTLMPIIFSKQVIGNKISLPLLRYVGWLNKNHDIKQSYVCDDEYIPEQRHVTINKDFFIIPGDCKWFFFEKTAMNLKN